jgi:hypothetical protein
MQHWWRDNDHGGVWKSSVTFGASIDSPPVMIEGEFERKNENDVGTFELCVAVKERVQHWWRYNHGDGVWRNSATFGHNIKSVISLGQCSYGFNLEVIVLRTDNKLQHYWRGGNVWNEGVIIGSV